MSISPSDEELNLIRDFIMLPFLIHICETQLRKCEYSNTSLKNLYSIAAVALRKSIQTDFVNIKKELRKREIKVFEESPSEATLKYRLYYRGYESPIGFMKEVIKAEVGIRLAGYITRLGNRLSAMK